jgi:hypothetical protein
MPSDISPIPDIRKTAAYKLLKEAGHIDVVLPPS